MMDGTIDVIPVRLVASSSAVARALTLLSDDERMRGDALRTEALQAAFVLRRAALRVIVGDRTGIGPREVRFAYTALGKPSTEPSSQFAFSASSSDDLAVIACSMRGDIGIDIERARAFPDMLDVARASFTREDVEAMQLLIGNDRERAFFALWTRKEARAKASGAGLSRPERGADVVAWDVASVAIDPAFVCSVAYRHGEVHVRPRDTIDAEALLCTVD